MKRIKNRYAKLSNGQILSVHFDCCKNFHKQGTISYFPTIIIGKSKHKDNDWLNPRYRNRSYRITGECGLEGVLKAKKILNEFMDLHKGIHLKIMQIEGYDKRRTSAYRILTNDGFMELYDGVYVKEF